MRRRTLPAAVAACLLAHAGLAGPAPCAEGLTLDAALARARGRAPIVLAAARRLEEARGRAQTLPALRDNPEIEAAVGRREDGRPHDLVLGVSQTLELGGGRGARRALAGASVARETAALAEAERAAARHVASAFLRALQAEERIRVAESAEAFAADLRRVAQRRHDLGEVAALDVNAAVAALGRARAELKAAQAERASARGDLRVLLDLPADEPLGLSGRLYEPRQDDVDALVAAAKARADVRVLEAELAEAEAEVRAGRAAAWPELTPALRYERDEGDRVLWGGLTVRLPIFDRGQERRAAGRVRADRIRQELAALQRAVETRVRTAHAAHALRAAAAEEMQATLAAVDDSEQLARRSYEEGQIGLAELLIVRRESAETRRDWLEALLEAAQARYDLEAEAGVSR
jgi:cobalt-zinc-cadmium efflux system outer membrane protein